MKFVIGCAGGREVLVPGHACTELGLIYWHVRCGRLPVRRCTRGVVLCVLPVPGVGREVIFVSRFTRMEAGLLLLCISASGHVPRHATVERRGVSSSRCA